MYSQTHLRLNVNNQVRDEPSVGGALCVEYAI
jgi:hypothetical protein